MKLSQPELLVSIADRGSISTAADFFGLTQPTESHQIQRLEQELGVELVLRKSRGHDSDRRRKIGRQRGTSGDLANSRHRR